MSLDNIDDQMSEYNMMSKKFKSNAADLTSQQLIQEEESGMDESGETVRLSNENDQEYIKWGSGFENQDDLSTN